MHAENPQLRRLPDHGRTLTGVATRLRRTRSGSSLQPFAAVFVSTLTDHPSLSSFSRILASAFPRLQLTALLNRNGRRDEIRMVT
jgi:hypothetical protein